MSYNPSDFRKGLKVIYKNDPYEITLVQMSLRGRGRSKYKCRLKNLRTGAVLENTFTEQDEVGEGDFSSRDMQFLYHDAEGYHFMDTDTYEQIRFPEEAIGDVKYFIKDGETYSILLLGREALNVDLPAGVILEIEETEPAVRGDSVSNVTKNATTTSGLTIKVPLFIDIGEKVKVDTRSMEYLGRG